MKILIQFAVLLGYLTAASAVQMLALGYFGIWATVLFPVLVAGQIPLWEWGARDV